MKCLVHECPNKIGEGSGVLLTVANLLRGDDAHRAAFICSPCWYAITTTTAVRDELKRRRESSSQETK